MANLQNQEFVLKYNNEWTTHNNNFAALLE